MCRGRKQISFFENCGIDIKNNSLIEMMPIQNNGRTTDNTYVLQVTNIDGQEITSSTWRCYRLVNKCNMKT